MLSEMRRWPLGVRGWESGGKPFRQRVSTGEARRLARANLEDLRKTQASATGEASRRGVTEGRREVGGSWESVGFAK